MKAILLTGLKQMEIGDVPEPKIEKSTDVLLKIERIGVCGSDVHYYETGRIGSQIVEYPYITGHECAATVMAVGDSVTRVKAGDEVAIDPAVSCYECAQCKLGRENTCYNLRFLGTPGQGHGCLCEYLSCRRNPAIRRTEPLRSNKPSCANPSRSPRIPFSRQNCQKMRTSPSSEPAPSVCARS